MPPTIPVIRAPAAGTTVIARIADDRNPQVVIGHVWRYLADSTPDGKIGAFSSSRPALDIGTPAAAADKIFMITGMVLNMDDNPPSAYDVTAELSQGGVVFARLAVDGGSGSIGAKDQPFLARFRFQ